MATPARHPFFAHAIASLPLQAGLRHPVGATGPQFLTRVWWSWVSSLGAPQPAGRVRTDGDDAAVVACHRCRSPSNWSALLASAAHAATSLEACNPWLGQTAGNAPHPASVPPHQPRRAWPCAADSGRCRGGHGNRRGSPFVRPTVAVYHNPVTGKNASARGRHGEAVVDLGSVMMRRNNNPCSHGTDGQIARCLTNPTYPDVSFVTFWTGSWIKPTLQGWTAKNLSWPSATERISS